MKLLILAGGYGTRLYPLVKDTPKALLKIKGKSLIDHTLEKFYPLEGIDKVVVVTNTKFHKVLTDWATDKEECPFPITVLNDGTMAPEDRLGAIGDILFVLDKVGREDDWLVAGSDNLFDFPVTGFVDLAKAKTPAVTIGAYDTGDLAGASKYGVLAFDEDHKLVSLEEKPEDPRSSLISMCLYYFPQASLPTIGQFVKETGKSDTTGGYLQWLYKNSPVYGFQFSGQWYDIGSLESYNEAQERFSA